MKKNVIKTAVAAVCVVAAGMGGFKAYNVAAQSETDMLLAENIEALSAGGDKNINENTTIYTKKCLDAKWKISKGSLITFVCRAGTSTGVLKPCPDPQKDKNALASFASDAGAYYCWTTDPR